MYDDYSEVLYIPERAIGSSCEEHFAVFGLAKQQTHLQIVQWWLMVHADDENNST